MAQKPISGTPPNIIHIFADDLGYGDIGCFGATDILTPNIDRIAKEGIQFTAFYSASPVCSPSRAGLLTGRMPQRMGINSVFFPESFTGMSPDEITIAEMLKEKNYACGLVGKWHLGHHYPFLPLQQGFDEYFGIPYSNDMEAVVYMRGNEVESFEVDQRSLTRTYTREALDYIERHQESPFFLYLAHNMPHVPIYASEAFLGTSKRGLYGDVVQELDWSVGQILDKLEELNLLENTLIVFSSDNGPWLVMEEHGGSAGELREGKNYTFEGGMRVPAVAMWQGNIPAGTVYQDMASQMDWFPTIAKLTGIALPSDRVIDGRDLSGVLLGTGAREQDSYLYYDGRKLEAYRTQQWKVKLPFEGYPGSPWKEAVGPHDSLLINLLEDPGERQNLYSMHPEMAQNLFAEMRQAEADLGPLPPSLVVRNGQDNGHFDFLAKGRSKHQLTSGGYLDIGGTRLKYVIEGQGTPCLVIGSSVYYPRTFSPSLQEQLKMHYVDLRWFAEGNPSVDPDSQTIESIVEDIDNIRKALGLHKPVLIGHSIHGTIAMEYVKRYPQHVSSLVMIGSPSEFGTDTYQQKAAALWAGASPERKAIQEENWGQLSELDRLRGQEKASADYHRAGPQYWFDPHYDARWLWEGMTVHSELTEDLFSQEFHEYDMFADMPLIRVPVLVMMGKYDYVIPYTLWKSAYESIPDFRLQLFERSGHTPQIEEPELFNKILLEWLL